MRRREFLSTGAATTVGAAAAAVAGAAPAGALPGPPPARGRSVRTGFVVLQAQHYAALAGAKVGMIANPTSITRDLSHEVDLMHVSADVQVTAAFGPEHGFRGTAQAGGSEGFYIDAKTGLPVYDLYGASIATTADLVTQSGVDVLVFDIQDIGARFYTYIWTLYRSLAAAAQLGIPFVVLDRPNPIGGDHVAGPVLHPALSTGVGVKAICQQHGMTVGELAMLFNGEFVPGDAGGRKADLSVIELRGWLRTLGAETLDLPWVPPSPNIPGVDSAYVYPGNGMFEGTNLSEGRGTTRPFEIIGAPYVDYHWAEALRAMQLPGVGFREAYFAPTFSKYVNETCGGVQLYITDHGSYDTIRTAVAMIISAKSLYAKDFLWRYDTGDAVDPYWIDKLSGSDYLRTAIDAGKDVDAVVAGWQGELAAFERVRRNYLIYKTGGRR